MTLGSKGQSVVETALVLPVLFLGIFTALQLIWYCHNMIELQRMAGVAADRLSLENLHKTNYHWISLLQGPTTIPKSTRHRETELQWIPARGVHLAHDRGVYATVRVETMLLPGTGFSRVLGAVRQDASAQTLIEAEPPRNVR
jgi:hypothetical protein